MVKESHIVSLGTVCECNRYLGGKTWHPQVSLIALENTPLEERAVRFGFHAVLMMEKAKKTIDNCILTGQLSKGGLLSAGFIAATLGISSAYFTDLLQLETGHTPEEFFQIQRMQAARRMLLCPRIYNSRSIALAGLPQRTILQPSVQETYRDCPLRVF